jgi:hypothetical protein
LDGALTATNVGGAARIHCVTGRVDRHAGVSTHPIRAHIC